MADSTNIRSGLRAYATEQFVPEFVSKQYDRSQWLAILASQKGADRELRPKGDGLTGGVKGTILGGSGMTRAQRMSVMGSESVAWGIHTGTSGGVKNLTSRDTVAGITDITTNSQDQKKKMTKVLWTHKQVECVVWNSTRKLNRGKFAIMSAIDDGLGIAMQDLFDSLITEIWIGMPSDQTADYFSEQIGVNDVCKDDNVCYGIERNGTTYFDGRRVTSSKTAALKLIDDANITQGIQNKGPGVDVCLCNASAYLTMKQEALAKGGIMIHKGTPQAIQYGITKEAVLYGNVLITYDAGLKDYSAITSGDPNLSAAVFMATISDWCFQTMEDQNFSVGEFIDIGKYTRSGQDARRALIDLMFRTWCFKPWNQILYTTVA